MGFCAIPPPPRKAIIFPPGQCSSHGSSKWFVFAPTARGRRGMAEQRLKGLRGFGDPPNNRNFSPTPRRPRGWGRGGAACLFDGL